MGSFKQIAGGVAGGLIGFFAGGPVGAIQGFALGYAITGAIFPPDFDEGNKPEDPFQVTTATEGTAVPLMFGRRRVPGNVIYFGYDSLEIKEVTPNGKGKGGFGKASDQEFGTFSFAPVAIGVCLGNVTNVVGIVNSRDEDWITENTDQGGNPILFSTPSAPQDFQYGPVVPGSSEPASSPLRGITVAYSSKLFLGQNTRNATPLTFDVFVSCSAASEAFCGSSIAGMPSGCVNPANVYYDILTNLQWSVGLPAVYIDQASFQSARQRFQDEGLGIAPLWLQAKELKKLIEDLNSSCMSIMRRTFTGKLELYPIRDDNYTLIPLPEKDCGDENASGRSWRDVFNVFLASFPNRDDPSPFTQRTIPLKNEAAIAVSGLRLEKTYDFAHITDKGVATRLLEDLKRVDSFPSIILNVRLPKAYHFVRVGDVFAMTHSKFDLDQEPMRVVEITDDPFGGMGIRMRLVQEVPKLAGHVGPTLPVIEPPMPDPNPAVLRGVSIAQEHWRSRLSPPPWQPPTFPPGGGTGRPEDLGGPIHGNDNETGYFGYPLIVAAARGKSSDVGALISVEEGLPGDMPSLRIGSTLVIGRAHLFTLEEAMPAGEWRYAEQIGLKLLKSAYGANDVFDLPNQDGVNVDGVRAFETSPWVMLIGNYEFCAWGRSYNLGNFHYEFQMVIRAINKVRLLAWPVGTPVMIFRLKDPEMPNSLDSFLDWAHRPRHITEAEYDAGRRLRIYAQAVSYSSRIQDVADETVFEPGKFDAAAGLRSGVFLGPGIQKANRGPTPAAQIFYNNAISALYSWYPFSAATGDYVVQFQPFPNDYDGIGDRTVTDDEYVIEPLEDSPFLPTDKATYNDYLKNEDGGRAYGLTYRVRVYKNKADLDAGSASLVKTVLTVLDGTWPAVVLTATELATLGIDPGLMTVLVDVLASNGSGRYSIPQFAARVGWNAPPPVIAKGGGSPPEEPVGGGDGVDDLLL